jgi:hypothetical protein
MLPAQWRLQFYDINMCYFGSLYFIFPFSRFLHILSVEYRKQLIKEVIMSCELEMLSDAEFEPDFTLQEVLDTVFVAQPLSADTIEKMKAAKWKHNGTGDEYRLVAITNLNADLRRREEYPITAVYVNVETGDEWSKPLERFILGMSRAN